MQLGYAGYYIALDPEVGTAVAIIYGIVWWFCNAAVEKELAGRSAKQGASAKPSEGSGGMSWMTIATIMHVSSWVAQVGGAAFQLRCRQGPIHRASCRPGCRSPL